MAQYLLAADGGGTKTEVLCTTTDGEVVGHGLSGPTNLTSTSVGAASFNLKEAIRQAVETLPPEREFVVLAMGLAGADSELEEQLAHRVFTDALTEYHIGKIVLVNDSHIALMNGTTEPNGIVVISGTGSISYGKTADGWSFKSWQIKDLGMRLVLQLFRLQSKVSMDGLKSHCWKH
jgi:N-acetylglucosamine kinase-like BadF-type ATPase